MSFLPPRAEPYPPHDREPPVPPERPAPPPEPTGGPAAWPLWSPFAALVVAVLAAGMVSAILLVLVEALGIATVESGEDPPPGVTIAGTFVQDILFAVGVVGFAWMFGGRPRPADFGLRRIRWRKALLWTFVAWLAFFAFGAIYGALVDVPSTDDLPKDLGADEHTSAMLATALLVCVMAPIGEELLFRGFLFGVARERMHVVAAILLSGVIFGAVHAAGSPVEFLPALAVLGCALAWLYHHTGSLYPCIGLHMFNNSIAFGVALDWSWQIPVTMLCSGALLVAALRAAERLEERPA